MARFYEEAAKELEAITTPNFRDLGNIEGNYARAAEARGFRCLNRRPPDLKGAVSEFQAASYHASRGEKLLRDVTRQYLWYLRYWKHVAMMGLLPLQLEFTKARRHVDMARAYAYKLSTASKLSTFPKKKWYVSLEDIDNQKLIISAYEEFIANRNLPLAQHFLEDWLQKSGAIADMGRYKRLNVRKLAIDFLLAWKAENSKIGKPQAEQVLKEMFKYIESEHRFGANELFIRDTVRSLFEGQIDYEAALERIASVFILDAPLPVGKRYIDLTSKEDKAFRQLPQFFQAWLKEPPEDMDKMAYVFLAYVRCVAEFWSSVYRKRRDESRLDLSLSCKLPGNFAWTDWHDLLSIVTELARVFDTEPQLCQLRDSIKSFQNPLRANEGVESLRAFIIDVISSTQSKIFPHPVLLERFEKIKRGRLRCTLQRFWQSPSQYLELTLLPRLGQELVPQSYYFLKPSYKRIERLKDVTDEVLYPLHPASSFGVPLGQPFVLLVEGNHDLSAFQVLFERYNPCWKANILIEAARGAPKLVKRYRDLRELKKFENITVVADWVGGPPHEDIEEMEKTALVSILEPDFEGVDPASLKLALKEVAPDIDFTDEDIAAVVSAARFKEKATVTCLKERPKGQQLFREPYWYTEEHLKTDLAIPLSRAMISLGLSDQILVPLSTALNLAFGHPSGVRRYG